MCVRTREPALIGALQRAAGMKFLASPNLVAAVLSAQPNRVMLSLAGRIEVFQPIPNAHDVSPVGPHTHLLSRLIESGWLHNANDPIPTGWQVVLNMHPPRPWVGERGSRHLDRGRDQSFRELLDRYCDVEEVRLQCHLTAHGGLRS